MLLFFRGKGTPQPTIDVEAAKTLLTATLDEYFVKQLGYSVARTKKTRVYQALVALGGSWH